MAQKPLSPIGITFMLIALLVPSSIELSQSHISMEKTQAIHTSGHAAHCTHIFKSAVKTRFSMSKLPKCAYKQGDLVTKEGQMGIVTDSDGDFFTFQLLGLQPITHTTMNISIKHYLKLVKAQAQIMSGQGSASEFVARNLTLEEELLEGDPQPLITGEVNRHAEDTKNKLSQGEV
tara:strand:+ start:2264 stop:2791 length:528 start_codon:yes stop_codon:yes gene_type:complete